MTGTKFTPGPWSLVEATEHHGPYVTSDYGSTICDCYTMSHPDSLSSLNGGPSKPISFMAEMAGPNAALIASSPALYEALEAIAQYGSDTLSGRVDGPDDRKWQRDAVLEMIRRARAALALARGEA